MAQRQLSRTLPKNFTFPSLAADGVDEPRTPERPSHYVDVPKAPRHSFSSCRLPRQRVRSGTDVCARMDLDLFRFQGSGSASSANTGTEDMPLPSIEVPQQSSSFDAPFFEDPANTSVNDDRFLAPPHQRTSFKTPEAQIRGTPLEHDSQEWPSWDQSPAQIQRPGSACSNLSDSSVESIETFASRPSVGGSCTSAESDFDSYFPLEFPKEPEMSSPTLPKKQKVQRNQVKDKSWTREMDNHLWNTYQLYLQDPTMTPFKMTPGSIPPLGVTSRVSRRAKRTWENKRHRITGLPGQTAADRSGSSTPKATDKASASNSIWPKSDAKTRSRLKHLCRRKFCIAPHYQRMMQSRSPEPVADMLGNNAESRVHAFAEGSCTTYATRDLGVSLVASAPTPLAQLAEEPPVATQSSSDWFNNPISTSPKAASPHASPKAAAPQLSNQYLRPQPYSIPPRLGSPFVYSTWGPGGSNRQVSEVPQQSRRETVHVPGRRLRRNTHFDLTPRDTDDVFSSDVYAKDPSDEEVHRRLSDYMHDNKFQDIGHGRVRIRNRGATTGAVGPRDVSQLFSPPSSLNSSQAEPEETTPVMKPPVNALLNLGGENIKRLGSPFKLEGGFKPRAAPGRFVRHAPSTSDPFSSGGIPPYTGPATHPGSTPLREEKRSTPSLQNPFEEGLSDAERIRRQILNMPYTHN